MTTKKKQECKCGISRAFLSGKEKGKCLDCGRYKPVNKEEWREEAIDVAMSKQKKKIEILISLNVVDIALKLNEVIKYLNNNSIQNVSESKEAEKDCGCDPKVMWCKRCQPTESEERER